MAGAVQFGGLSAATIGFVNKSSQDWVSREGAIALWLAKLPASRIVRENCALDLAGEFAPTRRQLDRVGKPAVELRSRIDRRCGLRLHARGRRDGSLRRDRRR